MTLRDPNPDIVITEDCPEEWLKDIQYMTNKLQCGECGHISTTKGEAVLGTAGTWFCSSCKEDIFHIAIGKSMDYPIFPQKLKREYEIEL